MNVRNIRWRDAVCASLLSVLVVFVGACGKSALPPPVKVTYRDSLWGVGKVVQITNNSSHHLYDVKVVGRCFKDGTSASVTASEHLAPQQSVEVGWLEFGTWAPAPGESIEIYCNDYASPKISFVPES